MYYASCLPYFTGVRTNWQTGWDLVVSKKILKRGQKIVFILRDAVIKVFRSFTPNGSPAWSYKNLSSPDKVSGERIEV